MSDRTGQRIGDYRLLRLLGRGNFAEVYLGEHTSLNAKAAVKVFHVPVNPEASPKFQEEARILISLRHPHIAHIFDFGIWNGQTPYLIMEYAPNGTLSTRHPPGTLLPALTVVSYIKQIAGALQYAHDRKVVHHDIKPANMLIGERDEILLSDFGIALVAQNSREQSMQDVERTFAYNVAPEQINGRLHPASDQYSLGIVVYEWLTGKRPFQGSLDKLRAQHKFVPPPSLRKEEPRISVEVEYVVMTALAKDPEQRFDSVMEFAQAFEKAVNTVPGELPNSPLFPQANKLYSLPSTGQYKLIEFLGEGAFGHVYKAQTSSRNDVVAIKLFANTNSSQQERLEKYRKEVRALQTLRHQHILGLIGVGVVKKDEASNDPQWRTLSPDDPKSSHILRLIAAAMENDIPYLVTQFASGGSLLDRLKKANAQPLSPDKIPRILGQVAEALYEAHKKEIIHGDVKPANILFDTNNDVLLADFGTSTTILGNKSIQSIADIGTALYMAPEQFEGNVSAQSDQYALGCIAYELFTGKEPFTPKYNSPYQLEKHHKEKEPPSLTQYNPKIPAHIEQAVLKALSKDRSQRFENVLEFVNAMKSPNITRNIAEYNI